MKINYFNTNKNSYKAGETATFFWEVENAETVELIPYGIVQSKGIQTITVPLNTSGVFTVRLIATNRALGSILEQKINLSDNNSLGNTNSSSEGDSLTSTIIQYIIVAVVLICLIGGAYDYIQKNYLSKSSTSNKVIHTDQNKVNQPIQNNNLPDCNLSDARDKALAKIKSLNLFYVGDQSPYEATTSDCSIRFDFYVKKINYDIDGKSYLEDKVYQLVLTYKKIGQNSELMDGKLFVNSTQYQNIN